MPVASSRTIPSPTRRQADKIRVLVVDDSVVVRRLLTRMLSEEQGFEVVGTAASAESALSKLPLLTPDVMTLDINMPGMSGLELLPLLRARFPKLRVLVFSGGSLSSAASTVDALMNGAAMFLMKPETDVSLPDASARFQLELCEKLRLLCHTSTQLQRGSPPPPSLHSLASSRPPRIPPSFKNREVLAIGVSTGGPTALAQLIAGLPHNFSLPVVIVQHMPPVFTRLLAERIQHSTGFPTVEAADGMKLQPGTAYLAPGDFHMRLTRAGTEVLIRLDQGPQECSCRPAVDVLFRSVAEVYGGNTIATILTGMGQDGLRGSESLVRQGAHLIAQDEATSVVWGMPGAVTQAGLVHESLPLQEIAGAILRQVRGR
ncbi:MAG: chemotaxis-specific protein-glutamate methyltransferase CheB [Micavibrio sp.]|nr:chemotaxis-specific protein-glutamate methyltransferase CheB [Micavibrio sp.]